MFAQFSDEVTHLSLAELARRTGLPRSTVHRTATELIRLGWLELVDGDVQLGMRLFELGQVVPRRTTLADAARPLMEDLHQATGFTVHLATLDKVEVVYLEILKTKNARNVGSRVGGRLPAHVTGVGKAMMAYSPEATAARIAAGLTRRTPYSITQPGALARELAAIRASGVAFDREESTLGSSCAAAPIFGPGPKVVAALSVTGPTYRIDPRRMAPAVRTAALNLSRQLTSTEPLLAH